MRYIIGIDLGTTNSAVAYVDMQSPQLAVRLFSIPQFVAAGRLDSLSTLPSFCYLINQTEWPPGSLKLPWKEETSSFVGAFAKEHGARVPTRFVQSAKSWLCNAAADRRDPILPLESADPSQRLSPVEASAKYLMHIKEAWNAVVAKGDPALELEEQDIILTVPASFDEVARTLTVEAARLAGFSSITLLEEPQSAFYSWIVQHEKTWEQSLKAGDSILVCDIGGGTTDFSLIEVQSKNERLVFQRMAVGDHLLLGGDNIDSALAHYTEKKLEKEGYPPLESIQWLQLLAEVRTAKEYLLSDSDHASYAIVLQGTGSSVIKGSLTVTLNQGEVERFLLEGFFGQYELKDALQLRKSQGFRTTGLPYEDEASITKHLAYFLQQAGYIKENKGPTYLLFNGGTMKPSLFQQAIYQSLLRWFPDHLPSILSSPSLDLAVARGAAYYGKVRKGYGTAIGGGLPRTYYLAVDIKQADGTTVRQALTLLTRGAEEEDVFQPEQVFSLLPNTPVAFHLMTSHTRLQDRSGDFIEIDEKEMRMLPPIHTVLRFGRQQTQYATQDKIPVRLGIRLTGIGTLDLWLESEITEHRWNLEFQLRAASGQETHLQEMTGQRKDETFEATYVKDAQEKIENLFDGKGSAIKPDRIMESLEDSLALPRREWSTSLLRGLWNSLSKGASNRKRSNEHEARWWNLAGFFLRPGFGFPLDDFRLKELWKLILGDLKAAKTLECHIQQLICFRRIAGGLNKGQQMQIASEIIPLVFNKKSGKIDVKGKSELYLYSERLRALAALERIDLSIKIRLGDALIQRILKGEALSFDYWALARVGARHLLYGSVGQVVPRDVCSKWIEQLLKSEHKDEEQLFFVLSQLARKTDHRELNLSNELLSKITDHYPDERLKNLLLNQQPLTQSEQEHVFGDGLPSGLSLEF